MNRLQTTIAGALAPVVILGSALALDGCNQASTVSSVNNTLSTLAGGDVKVACGIISQAESYYAAIVGAPSPTGIIGLSEASGALICANPPTDVAAAFATLWNVWTLVQSATHAPAGSPAPTASPTPN